MRIFKKINLLKVLVRYTFTRKFLRDIIAVGVVWDEDSVTERYLTSLGWVKTKEYWHDPKLKREYTIWVEVSGSLYRVYFGKDKTYIGEYASKFWFEQFKYLTLGRSTMYDIALK